MKKIFLVSMLLLAGFRGAAMADRSGDQGVGVMLGNPSGFSYKIFLDNSIALDAALGVAQGEPDAHITFLFHDFNILKQSPAFQNLDADMPLYLGVGPRTLFDDDDTEFGIRFVIGTSVFPRGTPWEFFGELAPVLRLTPNSGGDFDFAIGARYYIPAIRARD